MSDELRLSQNAFDELIQEHHRLVHLANELELNVYALGEQEIPSKDRVTECQQAAGRLIAQLRQTLFRFDQQIFPLLDPEPRSS